MRRILYQDQPAPKVKQVEVREEKEPDIKVNYYVPELTLPTVLLRRDLTKAVGVTILALLLQIILAVYLNRGGWQFVSSVLLKNIINF
ncbi:MAG: hypothetical protein UX91_C0006G0228 [Candidatus Amesbacteria bacterium GW2011_GWB1_47_19]|nr:MAG: hypothetical protein UW51_C0002G0229 [Candidatus Amesbacteria bacterium GW2011_GWA1_44_24]KKU31008.1 MAG: hypothetical protein UX46_C0008G0028 [Candidatus Amesbacteria bacterium GW2011_GWC1_46_24]KKU67166.1 MAG: hypothetical protein UX91_C0006G0228 [Candidatus Amesbacteria bacterium GW2011_GWB1_47_19]